VATYFDATADSADVAGYLPAGYTRTAPRIWTVVASQAEADVIGRYTAVLAPGRLQDLPTDAVTTQTGRTYTSLGDGTAVYLRGYTEDAADCTDAALVVAMKRAIADAIVWKLTRRRATRRRARSTTQRQGSGPGCRATTRRSRSTSSGTSRGGTRANPAGGSS
jgi:hypothetical protein